MSIVLLQIDVRQDGYKVDHSFSVLVANIDEVRAAFARLATARSVVAGSLQLNGPNLGEWCHLKLFQFNSPNIG